MSPLLANIALSVLDEDLHAPWHAAGEMSTTSRRRRRRWKGLPNWRLVRYADDFVVLTDGTRDHLDALRERITDVLNPMGLMLSQAKTRIVDMAEGFDFLGFHIQWRRKKGTNKWYVYTFIADRPLRSVKAKVRALTPRTSQVDLEDVGVLVLAELSHNPGLEERPYQGEHPLVLDPGPHPRHQRGVLDPVKARLDIRVQQVRWSADIHRRVCRHDSIHPSHSLLPPLAM